MLVVPSWFAKLRLSSEIGEREREKWFLRGRHRLISRLSGLLSFHLERETNLGERIVKERTVSGWIGTNRTERVKGIESMQRL